MRRGCSTDNIEICRLYCQSMAVKHSYNWGQLAGKCRNGDLQTLPVNHTSCVDFYWISLSSLLNGSVPSSSRIPHKDALSWVPTRIDASIPHMDARCRFLTNTDKHPRGERKRRPYWQIHCIIWNDYLNYYFHPMVTGNSNIGDMATLNTPYANIVICFMYLPTFLQTKLIKHTGEMPITSHHVRWLV